MVRPLTHYRETKLTGRVRLKFVSYFFGLRSKVVALVEYEREKCTAPRDWEPADTAWREAQVEDVGYIEATMDWTDAFAILSKQIKNISTTPS